ncbi:glycosyltransferase family 2 protein [uncultured Cocleimonas sp.]|uniref:glycosyltransferase family 2 protein n=1 Tax=uncultured Cocleimonas sp. TaxID=1051587 RepID=UPI00263274D4|nr:glycosyltransferase [uncultured Cocleimonas sp.]
MKQSKKNYTDNVLFIMVNYNGASDTIKCVESILSQQTSLFKSKIIIVDNASETEDIEAIKDFCGENEFIEIIESSSNIGYFPAFNIAIDNYYNEILEKSTSVIICNNDLVFDKNFLSLYFAKKYSSDTLVISPNVITFDGVKQNPHVLKRFSPLRKLIYKVYFNSYPMSLFIRFVTKMRRSYSKPPIEHDSMFIYQGIGACYILPIVFFKKIRRLDDRVFLGGEEALLSDQVLKASGKNFYDKELLVLHAEGASFKKSTSRWRYEQSKKSYLIWKDII